MFHTIWEFVQSADYTVQTDDPQNVYQSADWHAIYRLHNTNYYNHTSLPCCINIFLLQILISQNKNKQEMSTTTQNTTMFEFLIKKEFKRNNYTQLIKRKSK